MNEVAIRNFIDADIPLLAKYANNAKVAMHLTDRFPHPYTIEDAKSFMMMVRKQNPQTFFAITYGGEYVGNIALSQGTDIYRRSADVGYFVAEPFWKKGIASRAVQCVIEWGFQNLDIIRITAGVKETNIASQRVLEKCGFLKEGVMRKAVFKHGEFFDEIRYGLVRE